MQPSLMKYIYMLKLYKEVMLGTVGQKIVDFKDLRWYETLALLPLIIFIIYFNPPVVPLPPKANIHPKVGITPTTSQKVIFLATNFQSSGKKSWSR